MLAPSHFGVIPESFGNPCGVRLGKWSARVSETAPANEFNRMVGLMTIRLLPTGAEVAKLTALHARERQILVGHLGECWYIVDDGPWA